MPKVTDPVAVADERIAKAREAFDLAAREVEAAATARTQAAITAREARTAAAGIPSRATQNAEGKGK
jgi:hypothetical protein